MPKLEALHNYVDFHAFRKNFTLDTTHSDSDFSEVSVHGWDRLHLFMDFTAAPTSADTDILTVELAESTSTTDTDFGNTGTDQFSLNLNPGADSDTALGIVQADLSLQAVGVTSQYIRPSFSLAGTGLSVGNVNVYGVLYNGSGVLDHENPDTDVTVV